MEVEWLEDTGRGNRVAFDQLHQRYGGILFSAAYQVLNDAAEAEDVLQDVFVMIWDKALTWALTLTRNKSIDRLRSAQRRGRLREDAGREVAIGEQRGSDVGQDSVDRVTANETGAMVRQAVMQLSKEQRQAIEMAFFNGLTQSEIAERLHEPLGTVKARIRRGMIRLKGLMAARV